MPWIKLKNIMVSHRAGQSSAYFMISSYKTERKIELVVTESRSVIICGQGGNEDLTVKSTIDIFEAIYIYIFSMIIVWVVISGYTFVKIHQHICLKGVYFIIFK